MAGSFSRPSQSFTSPSLLECFIYAPPGKPGKTHVQRTSTSRPREIKAWGRNFSDPIPGGGGPSLQCQQMAVEPRRNRYQGHVRPATPPARRSSCTIGLGSLRVWPYLPSVARWSAPARPNSTCHHKGTERKTFVLGVPGTYAEAGWWCVYQRRHTESTRRSVHGPRTRRRA